MSVTTFRGRWDHHVGMALALLGGLLLLVKFKVHTLVLSLWPVALIYLGWQMYRKADHESPRSRRHGRRSPPPPAEDEGEDLADENLD